MSKVYVWHSVQECLPSTVTVEDGVERYDQGNNEVLHLLAKAMCSGALKVYDDKERLQPPPKDVGLNHYVRPVEVNKLFKVNDLPYEWHPITKAEKPPPLKDRIPNLELAASKIADDLRAQGVVERKINTLLVAQELKKLTDWEHLAVSSLENKLRVSMWRRTSR